MNQHTPARTCVTCGVSKPETLEFFAMRDSAARKVSNRFYAACRECQPPPTRQPTGDMKICRECGQAKPKTSEFFRTNGDNGRFKPVCKACLNLPPAPPVAEGMKRCTKCAKEKPATTEFFHSASGREGLRSKCKKCMHAAALTNQRVNVVRTRERYRARYWQNPEKFRLRTTLRKRKLEASGVVTAEDVKRQLASQGGKCYWCQSPIQGNAYHVDHIFPIAKGGAHTPGNICCACAHCNHSKGAKLPHEWTGRLF